MDFSKIKKHYIMIIAIMFVLVSLSDTTYSLFLKADSTANFTYNTGILDLQFTEDEQISLQNVFPIVDSEGMKTDAYTLKIKNIGSLPYIFDLKMLSNTEENIIDSKYIKFQVNNDKSHTLFQTNSVISSNNILYPNEEKVFNIRVWLDINTPNTELGKTFTAKIVTTGEAIYKTLDTSGANYPRISEEMIPVYYDEIEKNWKKADQSNTIENYSWYNYDEQIWANTVVIKDSDKQIYDITRNNDLKITSTKNNNGNYITSESSLDIGLSNYNYSAMSSIFRIKFNDLSQEKIYILSNSKLSYYYDTLTKKFYFQIGNNVVNSKEYELNKDAWYIIGYTYDSNKVTFYINGTQLSSGNITGSLSTNNGFKIGTNYNFQELSNFELGDIYIYKNSLSENIIKDNYGQTINVVYDNLLAGYNDFEPRTLKEYYLSQELGTSISLKDIVGFYVWIPRYKYRVWNVTGTPGVDSYDAYNKGIDIVFENDTESTGTIKCQNNICYSDDLMITKVTTKDNGKYYTHSAFTNGDNLLSGLWVSKYEISTNNSSCNDNNLYGCYSSNLPLEVKPSNLSWRFNSLSNFYQNIKQINSNYSIINNREWGAIAYLSHSNYGVCQNEKCNKITNNSTFISGNNLNDSTTLNMYGVFDLSGSASEFTMATYNNKINNTNFNSIKIENDDFDIYQDNTFILGDATKEISLISGSWDNNQNTFVDNDEYLFIRGGIGNSSNSGIFYYNKSTDNPNKNISTRIIIK